ncbi:MAG: hypothetical protein ACRDVM_00865 [Acidimicrobiia bacterium]
MTRILSRAAAGWMVVVMLALPAVALGQEYPLREGRLQVSDSTPAPGDPVTVSGGGFEGGARVSITFESDPVQLAVTSAGPSGAFSATVRIPTDAESGTHTLRAQGEAAGGGTLVLSTQVTIGLSTAELARGMTAFTMAAIVAAVLGAVGIGAYLVVGRR